MFTPFFLGLGTTIVFAFVLYLMGFIPNPIMKQDFDFDQILNLILRGILNILILFIVVFAILLFHFLGFLILML